MRGKPNVSGPIMCVYVWWQEGGTLVRSRGAEAQSKAWALTTQRVQRAERWDVPAPVRFLADIPR